MDIAKFTWTREPKSYRLTEDKIIVTTLPHTDLWQRTYYHFRNDNGPAFQHLGAVVTNHGYSDWATTEISASVKSMWYRLSRREDDYCIE